MRVTNKKKTKKKCHISPVRILLGECAGRVCGNESAQGASLRNPRVERRGPRQRCRLLLREDGVIIKRQRGARCFGMTRTWRRAVKQCAACTRVLHSVYKHGNVVRWCVPLTLLDRFLFTLFHTRWALCVCALKSWHSWQSLHMNSYLAVEVGAVLTPSCSHTECEKKKAYLELTLQTVVLRLAAHPKISFMECFGKCTV